MRYIVRFPLDDKTANALTRRQKEADDLHRAGTFDAEKTWKSARKTKDLGKVLATLKAMTGAHERCMYCLDSHGTDIEHFRPKQPYPEHMFRWPNMLLCCTECGRFKGDRFPHEYGDPLLIDPTAENPWDHLDFDPVTGNIVARFDIQLDDYSRKGQETVTLLQLDRREALAAGYRRSFLRLSKVVAQYLAAPSPKIDLPALLVADDDHGLLEWCLHGSGQTISPFSTLRMQHPELWNACLAKIPAARP